MVGDFTQDPKERGVGEDNQVFVQLRAYPCPKFSSALNPFIRGYHLRTVFGCHRTEDEDEVEHEDDFEISVSQQPINNLSQY